MHRDGAFLVAALVGLSTIGCSGEGIEGEANDAVAVTSDLTLSTDYGVDNVSGPTVIVMTDAPKTTSACFLVGVAGSFQDITTTTLANNRDNPNGWTFSISSNAGHSWARARCMKNLTSTQTTSNFIWSAGKAAVDMGNSTDRICFFSGVGGKFDGAADQVRIRESGGHWWLDGTLSSSSNYIIGFARCVTGVSTSERSGEYSVNPPADSTVQVDTAYANTSPNQPFCAFTKIGGKFNADADSLFVGWDSVTPKPKWFARGRSSSSPIFGGLRCVDKDAF